MKKTIGSVLLVAGIILAVIGFYQQSEDNKIIDIGELEIEQDSTNNINIMMIGGIVLVVGGIVVIAVGKK